MKTACKIIILTFFLVITSVTCQKPSYKTVEDILPRHQWRKTLEAVYNENGDFETYTFNFETAEDCEKNSYWSYNKPVYLSNMYITDLCRNSQKSFHWKIKNDSLVLYPWDFDTINVRVSKYIESYDERNFVLRYDTMIDTKKKIIKETFSAF